MRLRLNPDPIRHRNEPAIPSKTAPAPVPVFQVAITGDIAVPPQIEAFLDELSRSLSGFPAAYRDEARAEWLGHLLASVAAREEIGETHESAVAATLKAFGPATRQSRLLRKEHVRRARRTNPRTALSYASSMFSLAAFTDVAIATVWLIVHPRADFPAHDLWILFCAGWMALLSPFLTGWRVGRETRSRAIRASFVALLITPALLFAAAGILALAGDIAPLLPLPAHSLEYLNECLLWCGIYHVIRLPMGLLGAKLGRNPPRRKRAKAAG